jgi:Fe-S-cluster-containing dehydrogenase component
LAWGLVSDPTKVFAAGGSDDRSDDFAMLSDYVKCVGCRRCEAGCNKANNLPVPETSFEDPSVFEEKRRTDDKTYTVMNRYENPQWDDSVFGRSNCNHCAEPACASACLVGALKKTPEGPVIYNENVCIGCRYCMTACPWSIPTFEYFAPGTPGIRKCTMCYHRISAGTTPGCVESCQVEAITFGKRSDLVKLARNRIGGEPDKYIDHIYGEHEVGGTNWLYISGVPFEDLDLPTDLGTSPLADFTKEFLSAVPLVLVAGPALLGGFYMFTKRRQRIAEEEATNQKKEDGNQ